MRRRICDIAYSADETYHTGPKSVPCPNKPKERTDSDMSLLTEQTAFTGRNADHCNGGMPASLSLVPDVTSPSGTPLKRRKKTAPPDTFSRALISTHRLQKVEQVVLSVSLMRRKIDQMSIERSMMGVA